MGSDMEFLVIGTVAKPQGIRGELKIMPFTDDGSAFRGLKRVFLGGKEYKVLSVREGADCVFLGLNGVPDRNAAEGLRGLEVSIPRDEAPPPGEGRYYIADLLGCAVVGDTGRGLGVLKDIRKAATDIYTLEKGEEEILFPAVGGLILSVDVENRRIIVDEKRFQEVAVI